jgi:hypothetical protein
MSAIHQHFPVKKFRIDTQQQLANKSKYRAQCVATNIFGTVEVLFDRHIPINAFRYAIGEYEEKQLQNMIASIPVSKIYQSIRNFVGNVEEYLINDENCYGDLPASVYNEYEENFTPEECQLKVINVQSLSRKTTSFNNLRHIKNHIERCSQELHWCGEGLRSLLEDDIDQVLDSIDQTIVSLFNCSDYIIHLLLSNNESLLEDYIE